MSDEEKKVLRVSAETAKHVAKYAEKHDISAGDAADKLIGTAVSRLGSIARYAKNQKAEGAPAKPRAKKPAAAKKPAKKKAAAKKKVAAPEKAAA